MFAQYSQLVRYSAESFGEALRRFISPTPAIRLRSFCGSLANSCKLCRTNFGRVGSWADAGLPPTAGKHNIRQTRVSNDCAVRFIINSLVWMEHAAPTDKSARDKAHSSTDRRKNTGCPASGALAPQWR